MLEFIKSLKIGDIFYECQYGLNVKSEVVTEVEISEDKNSNITFRWNAKNVFTGKIYEYFVNGGYMTYSPKIYKEPEYISFDENGKPYFEFVGENADA